MRRFWTVLGVLLALSLAVGGFMGPPGFEIAGRLVFGWISYLSRVFPQVTISRDGLATGLGALIVFAIGLHFFLRWLHGEIVRAGDVPDRSVRGWKPRWTASIVAVVVLMFVAGIGATGLAHQSGWLLSTGQPRLVPKLNDDLIRYPGDSVTRLKWIGMGLSNWLQDREPTAAGKDATSTRPLQSWATAILPFTPTMTGGLIHEDLPWNHPRNSANFRGIVPEFLNPQIGAIRDADGYALCHYAGNIHVLGPRSGSINIGPDLAGSSQTIAVGEVSSRFKAWGDPTNLRDPGLGINRVPDGFGSSTPGGANFLFLDGSVRFVRDGIAPEVLRSMSRPTMAGKNAKP